MSYFPFISIEDTNATTKSLPLYREFAWDFIEDAPILVNGEFVIVEGAEAIKVWVYKTILTPRFTFPIYSWDYGTEIDSLIGTAYTVSLTKSEVARYIKEALSINEYITSVDVTDIFFTEDVLHATVNLQTIYGGDTLYV